MIASLPTNKWITRVETRPGACGKRPTRESATGWAIWCDCGKLAPALWSTFGHGGGKSARRGLLAEHLHLAVEAASLLEDQVLRPRGDLPLDARRGLQLQP